MDKNKFLLFAILVLFIILAVAGAIYFFIRDISDINHGNTSALEDSCVNLTENRCLKNVNCSPVFKSGVGSDKFGMPLFDSVFDKCGPKSIKTTKPPVTLPVCSTDPNLESCKQERDVNRSSDLIMLRLKLELYYNKFGRYPQSSSWADLTKILTDAELNSVPVANDPLAPKQNYIYVADSVGSDYVLGATLEVKDNKIIKYGTVGTFLGVSCGGQIYCIQQ